MFNVSFSIHNLEFFLLIVVRIATMVAIAPIFGNRALPGKIKIALAVFISILVAGMYPYYDLEYSTVLGYSTLVVKEAVVGLLLGFSANFATYIISFTGKMIDIDVGFSMVQLFDPNTNESASAFGSFYGYMINLIMLATNMHYFIIRAVIDSFGLIPLGGVKVDMNYMYDSLLSFFSQYFIIGFRIVLPVFTCTLLLNVILGILAKSAPQMNMFVIGLQLKIFLGLGVLVATIAFLPTISEFIFEAMQQFVETIEKGLY